MLALSLHNTTKLTVASKLWIFLPDPQMGWFLAVVAPSLRTWRKNPSVWLISLAATESVLRVMVLGPLSSLGPMDTLDLILSVLTPTSTLGPMNPLLLSVLLLLLIIIGILLILLVPQFSGSHHKFKLSCSLWSFFCLASDV